jgi:hypothetical protein
MKQFKLKYRYKFKYKLSFLEKHIILRFLLNTKFVYGPYYNITVRPYVIARLYKNTLFNLYSFIIQLRKMLYMIYLHSYMHELIIIFAANQRGSESIGYKKFYYFTNWSPGFLTNFRILMRRKLAEHRYLRTPEKVATFIGALYVKKIPRLPTLALSFSTFNHWFYQEAHRLNLLKFTALDKSIPSNSPILTFNKSYLPIQVMLRLVRETIFASKVDERFFFIKIYKITKDPLYQTFLQLQEFNELMLAKKTQLKALKKKN